MTADGVENFRVGYLLAKTTPGKGGFHYWNGLDWIEEPSQAFVFADKETPQGIAGGYNDHNISVVEYYKFGKR